MNPEDSSILSGDGQKGADRPIPPAEICFDHYVLDLRRGALRSEGADIELRPKTFAWRLGTAVAVCVAVLIAIGIWRSGQSGSMPAAARPGKPAIAVLPFASPLGDGDYFADGMMDDVINALGRLSSLTVMSRSAAAAYKGQSVTPQQVGRELAVQ